ncbi:MAG: hypothetical protein ACLGPM_07970 [Acidobacteriota bacterium]
MVIIGESVLSQFFPQQPDEDSSTMTAVSVFPLRAKNVQLLHPQSREMLVWIPEQAIQLLCLPGQANPMAHLLSRFSLISSHRTK